MILEIEEMRESLRKDILTETYKDLQKLIFATAWDFWNIYGGSIEDLIGQANLIFIDAFDSYDSSRGAKLSTWIAFKVEKGLLNYMRKGNGYEPHVQIDDVFVETYPTPNKNFSVMELLDEMGQDAHIVLCLFLDTPRDIVVSVRDSRQRIDFVQAAMRNRLKNRLRQMGWSVRRIREAFEQIKSITSY